MDGQLAKQTTQQLGIPMTTPLNLVVPAHREHDAVDVFVRANTDRSFAAPCPSGSILVTPSAKRPGLWQLTFFDDSGTPQYDSQEPSFESCVRYAFEQWRADIDSVSFISFKEVS